MKYPELPYPYNTKSYRSTGDLFKEYAREAVEMNLEGEALCCGREECGGECGGEWLGRAITPTNSDYRKLAAHLYKTYCLPEEVMDILALASEGKDFTHLLEDTPSSNQEQESIESDAARFRFLSRVVDGRPALHKVGATLKATYCCFDEKGDMMYFPTLREAVDTVFWKWFKEGGQ